MTRNAFKLLLVVYMYIYGAGTQIAHAQIVPASEVRMTSKAAPAPLTGAYKLYVDTADGTFHCLNPSGTSCMPAGTGGGGAGTVTSVGLTVPGVLFTVSGSPITGAGSFTFTLINQNANTFLAGPATGIAAAPGFRSIIAADIPTLNQSTTGNAATATALDHNPADCAAGSYATGVDATGAATGCTVAPPGTVTSFSAGNLSPLFTSSVANPTTTPSHTFTLSTAAAHTFLGNNSGATAAPAYVQPAFSDLSGVGSCAQEPALTGDVTSSGCAATITAIQGKTVSGTTGTVNVVYSTAPTIFNDLHSGYVYGFNDLNANASLPASVSCNNYYQGSGSGTGSYLNIFGNGGGCHYLLANRATSVTTNVFDFRDDGQLVITGTGAHIFVPKINNIVYADQMAGADWGIKLNACIAAVSNNGGTCDARGLLPVQSATSTTVTVNKSLKILLPPNNLASSANPVFDIAAVDVSIEGLSQDLTVVVDSSTTGDIFKIESGSTYFHVEKISTYTTGNNTTGAAFNNLGAGHGTYRDLKIWPIAFGIKLNVAGGGGTYDNIEFGGADSTTTWVNAILIGGVATGTVTGAQFTNISISSATPFSDYGISIDAGADTIQFSNLSISRGGSDIQCLNIKNTVAGLDPAWIEFHNSHFEAGPTKNCIVISAVRLVNFFNQFTSAGLQNFVFNGGRTVHYIGGAIMQAQTEGAIISATPANEVLFDGVAISDSSNATTNTSANLKIAANVSNVHIVNSIFKQTVNPAPTNIPVNDILIATGTSDNILISGNTLNNNVTAGLSDGGTGTNKFICGNFPAIGANNTACKYGQADIVADSAGINTTETIIVKTSALPANRLIPGTHVRFTLIGTCTTTVANASTFTLRMGTNGTTADTSIATPVTAVAGTTGSSIPFKVVLDFTVRTVGATGTGFVTLQLDSQGTTGITATQTPNIILPTMSTFNTTTASNILSLSYKSAASTTTSTFKQAIVEFIYN